LALALLLTVTNTGATFGTSPDEADALEIEVALGFRATFGYSTSLELVTALENDPTANRYYSVALTADEVADMDRRMEIQNAMEPLIEYARESFPDTLGGIHIDQASGGVYYFSFTSDIDARLRELEEIAPEGAEIAVREVERTEVEIDELVYWASRDLEFHSSLGIGVHNVASNTARNGVDIFVEPYSDDVAQALQERYGPAVQVLPGTAPKLTIGCVNRDNCVGPPIMAGVSNDWNCTVGFAVHGSNPDTNRRYLTAGHCIHQVVSLYGWTGWEWFHHTVSLGLSTEHSWYDYSKADAGTMGNLSATLHSNRVMLDADPTYYPTTQIQGATSDVDGMAICMSGSESGWRCGTITSRNNTPCYDPTPPCGGTDDIHMANQRKASYFGQVGDSGAPVVLSSNRNKAVGLQSGQDAPTINYYSHIGHVQAELGQYVSTTN
jgi:hypothetical protein